MGARAGWQRVYGSRRVAVILLGEQPVDPLVGGHELVVWHHQRGVLPSNLAAARRPLAQLIHLLVDEAAAAELRKAVLAAVLRHLLEHRGAPRGGADLHP